ncbi:MAG: SDR family NAD(P)-dependent oxidoreductase [Pirellulales bacterium]|nr:SDR family NAD(P)-dependent oxidoreductase [Pirellulales bacterium]
MQLAGKTAVITGGGTGIGQAIALAFAREGCRVAIGGRRLDKLEEVVAAWNAEQSSAPAQAATREPQPILARELDVADRTSVDAFFSWVRDKLGPVAILVNNAGANLARRSMRELDPADWDRLVAVNATGSYNCLHAALPDMRERKDGVVINISSIAGKRAGLLGGVAYNASKFAQTALATSVALEEGKNYIRVSTIFPGEVETPILEHRPTPVSAERRAVILQPDDVAAAALFIAKLPKRAHVPELIIKPTVHDYA